MPSHRMKRPPAPGKTQPPRLGRVFARERLFAELDRLAAPGLWLKGPPGVGKTTLMANYLQAGGATGLWLQLDAGDADPASFAHFLQLSAGRQPARGRPSASGDDLRDVPGFVRRCFRHLMSCIEPPWTLVLDNLQEIGAAPELHAGIADVLQEVPAGCRLVLISREAPPQAYARALANQHLDPLDEALLPFDDAEAQQLVSLHGKEWPGSELRRLTDGWVAAMVLMLAARSELEPGDLLRSRAARERVFEFFATEVLAGMATDDARALTCIAFLPSTTSAMAVDVSAHPRAGALLDELVQRGLFTDRREGDVPQYSFHALFGEFLRERAAAQLDVASLRNLNLRAAALLASHGQADAAISRLIAAKAWPETLALVHRHASRFAAQGRLSSLREWLLAVPETERDVPQAWYWLGHCGLATNPQQALEQLTRAHTGFASCGDTQGSFFAAAAAADAMVFSGGSLRALDPWFPLLEAHIETYLATDDVETDLRVLPGLLAAYVHRATAHPRTSALADRAERLLDQPQSVSQRILLGTLVYFLLWTGQTARLDRVMAKVDRLCAAADAAPATLMRWYSASVMIHALRGDVDEALRQARRASALAAEASSRWRARASGLLALASLAGRDAPSARAHLADAMPLMDGSNPRDASVHDFQRGLLMLLEADWAAAHRLMRSAAARGRESGWPQLAHTAMLGHALAATQVGACDEAEVTLTSVVQHPFHAACVYHHWLAALIESHLAERRGQRERALQALARAFALGREHGYDFGPMVYACGDMMPRLAALALEHGIDDEFARRLIRRHALPAPSGAGERWPWPLRVSCLGGFVLQAGTRSFAPSRKESRKALDLLKLTIALGPAPVRVERLAGLLWPEAEGDAAQNSFDNTLHRLRKRVGESQLLLHAGALSLDPASCWTDVAELMACLQQIDARVADVGTEAAALMPLAQRAITLYQGDFLPGDEALADVLLARHRLRAAFLRVMGQLAAGLEAHGQVESALQVCSRVLERAPLAEEIVRRLMRCLLALGRRAEALEAYRAFARQLAAVLGVRPAAETEALAESLLEP